ncbi:hypothetical protein L6R53_26365 [Myxococcota bacterium]|nr:hypothetical protein [Myxococcota bacterium]
MSPPDPDLSHAEALLGDTLLRPVPRARRVAGLYAALYLEDPLLHQWGGLAALVARHVHLAMESTEGALERFMARGNLDIYRATMPAFLRFRRRAPAIGPLRDGFDLLLQADTMARQDLGQGQAMADRGLTLLAEVEQRDIVQPAYDELGPVQARLLAPFLRFRMGWDPAAPLYDFDGTDPRQADQRVAWARREVLPAWRRLQQERPDLLRAELDRLRRWAGVRMEELGASGPGRP